MISFPNDLQSYGIWIGLGGSVIYFQFMVFSFLQRRCHPMRFPLSRFLAKTLRVNKTAMKSFSGNLSFGVDFKTVGPANYV